jgi:plastocyanin
MGTYFRTKKKEKRRMKLKGVKLLSVIGTTTLLLAACGPAGAGIAPSSVTFDVELIEIKGSTSGIAAPELDPTGLSAGYRFKPPGEYDSENPTKWEVSSYMFSPGAMSVVQGDEVALRMFGINGDEHLVWVAAPDGSVVAEKTIINRGREVVLSFTAMQTGHYKLLCGNHAPTMQADILAIPAS